MARIDSILRTSSDVLPLKETLPIRNFFPGAKEAVLLLHGYSGHPGELRGMAEALAATGRAVSVPRYPGHGTCRSDFMLSKAEEWIRCAFDAYMELRTLYPTVHVLGHSMGAVIASAIAASYGAPKLILLAPAFELTGNGVGLAPLVYPWKPVIRRSRPLSPADEADPVRRALHAEYWADDLIPPAVELGRVIVACRRNLPRLASRTLVLAGDADQTVPLSVLDYIRKTACKIPSLETRILPGATHIFPFDSNGPEAARQVVEWIEQD